MPPAVADERQLLQFIEAVAPQRQNASDAGRPVRRCSACARLSMVAPLYRDNRVSVIESGRMSTMERPQVTAGARCMDRTQRRLIVDYR